MKRLGVPIIAVSLVAAACAADGDVVAGEREPAEIAIATATVPPRSEATATPPADTEPEFEPTATPDAAPTAPAAPTPTVGPTATPQPEGPCDAGPLRLPDPNRPRYRAALRADPTTGTVEGEMSVTFTPDLPVDLLVLRLWPNGPRPASGGVEMNLSGVTVDGAPTEIEVAEPTLVVVPLDDTLAAGDTVTLSTAFELRVPADINSRISRRDDYMRLGTALPLLPWEPGVGWATDPATALFAEAVSSPVADYEVSITVPDDFGVLASGVDDGTGTWRVEAARDFAFSIGRFRTVVGTAQAPQPVTVTVGVHETLGDDPQVYLDYVVAALEQFSGRWGQYPWPSLSFALTPNLSGGIEFPTHVMQGPDTIGRTTSHEVGHMWFYSLVGNNQGAAPWLDEGLTSYAEFTFEGTPPGAYPIPTEGVGQATQPMTFWAGRSDLYYRSVYGQTGFALQRLGPREDVDCALAVYVADNAHQIATAADFLEAFEPLFPDVVAQLAAQGVVVD